MEQMQTKEVISALADGQLRGEAFARGVELAAGDAQAAEAWHTYHLIGDVLRSGDLGGGSDSREFLGRLQARLAQEDARPLALVEPPMGRQAGTLAANDDSFRWKLVAGFASIAAVAAVGWTLVGLQADKPGQAQLAANGAATPPAATVLANTESGPMIRDPRLDELLAAHRQLGGASALQMPAGFLRNATFETPAR